jgi:hypothetical protein
MAKAYATRIDWDRGENWVILTRYGEEVAKMTLDDWMELSAVRYAAEELMQTAGHSLPPADRAGTAATAEVSPPRPRRRRAGAYSPE